MRQVKVTTADDGAFVLSLGDAVHLKPEEGDLPYVGRIRGLYENRCVG